MFTGHFNTDQISRNHSKRRARAGFDFYENSANDPGNHKTSIDPRAITSDQLVKLMTDPHLAWDSFPVEPSADPEMSENLAHQMTITVAAARAEHLARSRSPDYRAAHHNELPAAEEHLAIVVAGLRSIHTIWLAIPAA